MNLQIPDNLELVAQKMVLPADTAASMGSGLAQVFSTPAMIAFMENTALRLLQAYLPEGYSTVGVRVEVEHLKAVLPGTEVHCKAKVLSLDGLKILFSVEVFAGELLIGRGTHHRFVVDSAAFMKKLQ